LGDPENIEQEKEKETDDGNETESDDDLFGPVGPAGNNNDIEFDEDFYR